MTQLQTINPIDKMTENPAGPERLHIETLDARSTEDALTKIYGCTQFRHSAEPSLVHVTRGWLGRIMLDTLKFSNTMTFNAAPLGRIGICRVHAGIIETRTGTGDLERSTAGDLLILPASKIPFSGRIHRAHLDLTMLDITEFNHLIPAAPETWNGAAQFTSHRPISSTAADRLSRLIDYLLKQMRTVPQGEQSPVLTAMAAQGLAATVLAALPDSAVVDPNSVGRSDDQQPAVLRRAITFIDENAHTDLALTNIAAAVDLTPRAVQYMFSNNLGISPMEYVRRTRLRLAHQDLITNNETTTTVGEIARKWGFTNPTRFVARYKSQYNCSPEKTLHSS